MDRAICASSVGKKYVIGHLAQKRGSGGTLRDAMSDAASSIGRKLLKRGKSQQPTHEDFWALRDVSFELKQGDRLGVIGRNGSGKSTLLKVISRITEPTLGRIELNGRVASLLEVGTGFHPELSGRENIFMNGAILGMSRAEIKGKMDEIVDFAEVDRFLDTPVKRYSSGMYVRLAFAVAAHLEPEILLVDEVLAVGDAQFQKKCLGKMDDVAKGGRTILFVSHNMTAVQSLCNRAVWLDSGKLVEDGEATAVVNNYLEKAFSSQNEKVWEDSSTAPGDDELRLRRVSVVPSNDTPLSLMDVSTPLKVVFEVTVGPSFRRSTLNLSMNLFNAHQIHVLNSCSTPNNFEPGKVVLESHIPASLLNDGSYSIDIMGVKDRGYPVFHEKSVVSFDLADAKRGISSYDKIGGVVRPKLVWEQHQ